VIPVRFSISHRPRVASRSSPSIFFCAIPLDAKGLVPPRPFGRLSRRVSATSLFSTALPPKSDQFVLYPFPNASLFLTQGKSRHGPPDRQANYTYRCTPIVACVRPLLPEKVAFIPA
jgi:hypothetical protein